MLAKLEMILVSKVMLPLAVAHLLWPIVTPGLSLTQQSCIRSVLLFFLPLSRISLSPVFFLLIIRSHLPLFNPHPLIAVLHFSYNHPLLFSLFSTVPSAEAGTLCFLFRLVPTCPPLSVPVSICTALFMTPSWYQVCCCHGLISVLFVPLLRTISAFEDATSVFFF